MQRFLVTPKHKHQFQYEYYTVGLQNGSFKIFTMDELKNDAIQNLIQRNALIIHPYIETKIQVSETKKSNRKKSKIQEQEPIFESVDENTEQDISNED